MSSACASLGLSIGRPDSNHGRHGVLQGGRLGSELLILRRRRRPPHLRSQHRRRRIPGSSPGAGRATTSVPPCHDTSAPPHDVLVGLRVPIGLGVACFIQAVRGGSDGSKLRKGWTLNEIPSTPAPSPSPARAGGEQGGGDGREEEHWTLPWTTRAVG